MKDSDTLAATLVQQAKDGHQPAFEQLVRMYQSDVRGFISRRIGNSPVVDDVAQEAFIAAIRNITQLKDNASVRGWLLGIARNKLIDHLRKASRQKMTGCEHIESILASDSLDRTNSSTNMEQDILDSLKQCIADLKPKAQKLVNRFYFDQETAEQISNHSNVSSSAVRMSLLRIRKSLATCIRNRLGTEFRL